MLVCHVVQIKLGTESILALAAGIIAGTAGAFVGYVADKVSTRLVRHGLAEKVDEIFASEYRHKIAVGSDDGLKLAWAGNRDETAEVVRAAPLKLPLFGEFRRRQLDRAAAKAFAAFKSGT